jgi:hypothetical protein
VKGARPARPRVQRKQAVLRARLAPDPISWRSQAPVPALGFSANIKLKRLVRLAERRSLARRPSFGETAGPDGAWPGTMAERIQFGRRTGSAAPALAVSASCQQVRDTVGAVDVEWPTRQAPAPRLDSPLSPMHRRLGSAPLPAYRVASPKRASANRIAPHSGFTPDSYTEYAYITSCFSNVCDFRMHSRSQSDLERIRSGNQDFREPTG